MKILTKEEEQQHWNATLKGGLAGGSVGLAAGVLGVYGAGVRYPAFRQLTLPLRAFLCTSAGTFGGDYAGKGEEIDLQNAQSRGIAVGHALSEPKASETTFQSAFADPSYPPSAIITADRFSRSFEASRHPEEGFKDETARARAEAAARRTHYEAFMAWGKENRYPIVGVSWVLSMGIALGLVGRSPYLSTQQKLVQARVYAQTLTIGVLIASAVFEVGDRGREEGRWETVKIVDPKDPEHRHLIDKKVHKEAYQGEDQWKDMVETEERKEKEKEAAIKEQERKDEASGKWKHKEKGHSNEKKKTVKKDEKKNGKEDGGEKKKE
ncbi:hypothetical protein MMC21_007411 [Puttea exsequens]|nr:hypothetical protein [Puttea exsequens]